MNKQNNTKTDHNSDFWDRNIPNPFVKALIKGCLWTVVVSLTLLMIYLIAWIMSETHAQLVFRWDVVTAFSLTLGLSSSTLVDYLFSKHFFSRALTVVLTLFFFLNLVVAASVYVAVQNNAASGSVEQVGWTTLIVSYFFTIIFRTMIFYYDDKH